MCNCGKKSCNTCCPKTIRGEKGKTGPPGPRGPQGAAGANGTMNMVAVNQTMEQAIVPSASTIITDMVGVVTTGVYAVWFEGTVESTGECEATYGIYLDGVLQGFDRIYAGLSSSIIAYQSSISCINGEVIVTNETTLTVEATVTTGTMTVLRGSLMFSKLQ